MSTVSVVMMTVPDEPVAVSIVGTVVEERLAACGNLLPKIRSIYRWQGEICDDTEVLVMLKTAESRFTELKKRLIELHPYECPEVIQIEVQDGSTDYLSWVVNQTT